MNCSGRMKIIGIWGIARAGTTLGTVSNMCHLGRTQIRFFDARWCRFGEWYEGYRNASWGFGPQDSNGYLFQRLSIYSDIHAAPRIRLSVQLTSDIEAGRNGGPRPVTDESKLFFETKLSRRHHLIEKNPADKLVLRLGRQESSELGH